MCQLEGLELLLDQPGRSIQVLRGHPRRVSFEMDCRSDGFELLFANVRVTPFSSPT